jgi:nitrite reductase (NO-forming)
VAVTVDLAWLAAVDRVVDLDEHVGRLVPAISVGFGLQMVTGALSFLLPVMLGRGALGNRRLTRLLELAWPARLAAVNLGVALRTFGPATGWTVPVAWWLIGLGIGWFVLLAVAAMVAARAAHRVTEAG